MSKTTITDEANFIPEGSTPVSPYFSASKSIANNDSNVERDYNDDYIFTPELTDTIITCPKPFETVTLPAAQYKLISAELAVHGNALIHIMDRLNSLNKDLEIMGRILDEPACRDYYLIFKSLCTSCYISASVIISNKVEVKGSTKGVIIGLVAGAISKVPFIGVAGSIIGAIASQIDVASTLNCMHNIIKIASDTTEMSMIFETLARNIVSSRFEEISKLPTNHEHKFVSKLKKNLAGIQELSQAQQQAANDVSLIFELLAHEKIQLPERTAESADIKIYAEKIAKAIEEKFNEKHQENKIASQKPSQAAPASSFVAKENASTSVNNQANRCCAIL